MANGRFVSYIRVSTQKQGQSGLGLEAQQEAVTRFLNGGDWELAGEFVEIESGRKDSGERPQLAAAMAACQKHGATLLVAKLDRLSRDLHFIAGLMKSKVKFVACDMPEANELTVHIMAAFAEHEAKRISQRTKDALAAAKARGVVLGAAGTANLRQNVERRQQAANAFADRLRPTLAAYKAAGMTQRQIVEALNSAGIRTAKGGVWSLTQVQRVLARL